MMIAQSFTKASSWAAKELGGPHHLHAYRQHPRRRRCPQGVPGAYPVRNFGKPYLPDQPNRYASGKSAQEAHEAIRPTDLAYTPDTGRRDACRTTSCRLYTLIYNRFVASQMTPAVFAVTNVEVRAAEGMFKAQGKILKFDGYRRVLPPRGKQEDALLPTLAEKQKLDLLDLLPTQHFTQPPPRYNEASLVKTLEKEGIGRPSTYATIISKIQERGLCRAEGTPLSCHRHRHDGHRSAGASISPRSWT